MRQPAVHRSGHRAAGLILAGTALFVASIGPVLAGSRTADDRPGRRVAVGGHAMYIDCEGSGSPTVVMDAGLGDSSVVWSRVKPGIATFTRVCSYDRAGYGDSDLDNNPRTSRVIADELHRLLDNAGESPPYVLVGHSFGGWNMQLFASTYPKQVAGLVLVDSSQIYEIERYQDELGIQIAPRANTYVSITPYVPPDLPPEQAARARQLAYDPITMRTIYKEWIGFRSSEHEVAQSPPLPDVPLVVLSRGEPIDDPDNRHGRQEVLWRTLQQEFVDRHPGALHLVAKRSGHYIMLEQPQLVVHGVCIALRMGGAPRLGCPGAQHDDTVAPDRAGN